MRRPGVRALPPDQTSPELDESGTDPSARTGPRLANVTLASASASAPAGQMGMLGMPVVVGQPYESSDDEVSGSDSDDSNAYVDKANPDPNPKTVPRTWGQTLTHPLAPPHVPRFA